MTLIEPAFRSRTRFTWALMLPVWTAVVLSLVETFISLGWGVSALSPIVSWAPLFDAGLGWVVPVLVAFLIGLVIDWVNPHAPREFGEVATRSVAAVK